MQQYAVNNDKIKVTALIIFLIFSRLSIAQDYYGYYEDINKAKLSLVEDSLEKGMNHYFETFEKFDFVFARDCFNALEVASRLENYDYLTIIHQTKDKEEIHNLMKSINHKVFEYDIQIL